MMKWWIQGLSGIVVIIFLTAFGLWLASLRPNRGTFEASVLIHESPAIVYAALLNPDMTKKWISGISEITQVPSGTVRVGTKFFILEDFIGQWAEMVEEITQLNPPHLVKYQVESIVKPSTHYSEKGEYLIVEEEGGTRFTLKGHMEFHSFLYRLLEPLITPFIRSKLAYDQKTLKELLES